MKDHPLYAVAFTVGMSALCGLLLTAANEHWHDRVIANEQYLKMRAIAQMLGIVNAEADRAMVARAFAQFVKQTPAGDLTTYEGVRDGKALGTVLEVKGRGRHDVIRGVLGIAPGNRTLLGLRIYQQGETPGLGGRITSTEWLEQFRRLPIVHEGVPGIVIGSKTAGPNAVDGVTGASKTMYSLQTIINLAIARYMAGGVQLEALDLGLGVDAVTRATPGYPRNLQPPPHLRKEIKRPPFFVPPGTANLALCKPVTSSMPLGPIIGELQLLTDGIKTCGEFDYVEADPGSQWFQIDLGRQARVYCVVVWHYYKNPIIYNDVIVQLADDATFQQNVRTVFNNDHDNSAGRGTGTNTAFIARWWGEVVDTRGSDGAGTPARAARIYSSEGVGGEPVRLVEIGIYGEPL